VHRRSYLQQAESPAAFAVAAAVVYVASAMKAARRWRFRPGLRLGESVPVLITIQLDFTLR
jgi:hypothetical protein